ncbi:MULTISPECIES: CDP-alcohol phosphatidyltransferase family protein [unclassified Ruminococcus]|uniref:CDP-alcohol phosphatidyltransferase family protein n=1 Tax=unclassified Ruminococcus TaxID=2608920 RepID=UPI00210D4ADD|nr:MULTISPECIES: CDP-alcohol phosphatidyltransferase family protein [unclassified Ruminococcus]MCQ4022135.1 hypothetical protein [Ruminococcus sp. zg-924]MCQ4114455.1 hypothetical protein [Ruminococcus sp. zg-921]
MGVEKNAEDKIFTIPNILSMFRIILIIPMIVFFLSENYIGAVICVVISGLSDMFDGMIARHFNQISKLGKMLDPIADKLTLVAVIVCIGILIPNVRLLVVILAAKDILMLLGGAYLIHKGITPPAAKWYGKLATVVFYVSITAIVAIEVFGGTALALQLSLLITILLVITSIAMIFALVMYALLFFQLLKDNKTLKNLK